MTRELLQQALDALRQCEFTSPPAQRPIVKDAITALRSALAAPMPEPVVLMALDDINELMHCNGMSVFVENPRIYPPYCEGEPLVGFVPLYFAPPAAPADIVMVPREPTPEMIEAAHQSDKEYSLRAFGPGTVLAQSGYDHWVAMISAAPPAAPAPVVREPVIDEMDAIASQYAHKLALDLECVLSDYNGKWWDTAMQTIGEYRMAMNRIHERESPTHMGEPVLPKISSGVGK